MESFASMKRKDLQKLAKKHGLRANAKNEDLIRELSELLNEKTDTTVESLQVGDTVNTAIPSDSDVEEKLEQQEDKHDKPAEEEDFMAVSNSEEKVEPLAPLYPDLSSEITTASTTTAPTLYPVLSPIETESVSESESEQKIVVSEKVVVSEKIVRPSSSPAVNKKKTTPKAVPETRRQNIIQQKKTSRADDIKEMQKTKRSGLAAANNKVSGANRPTKPKVKQTVESVAKAAATQKAKDKIKKKGRIDFDKLHAKQFNSQASIAQHQKIRDSRALEVLYGGLSRPFPSTSTSITTSTTDSSDSSSTPTISADTLVSSSSSSSLPSASSTGFAFKPPTVDSKTTSIVSKSVPTPAKLKTSLTSTTKSSSTPAKLSTTKTSSTPSLNRLTETKRTAPITVPAFQPPVSTLSSSSSASSSTTASTPCAATSDTTSVFLKIKDVNLPETSNTPKQQKPKPVFNSSKTPLKPTTTESKKQTPAPKRTNPTESASTSPSASSTEPPKKKSRPDLTGNKPSSYTPHIGPVPKFESAAFSAFSPASFKVAPKPKYDARKSLAMSAKKKTPKSIAKKRVVNENQENTANSIVC